MPTIFDRLAISYPEYSMNMMILFLKSYQGEDPGDLELSFVAMPRENDIIRIPKFENIGAIQLGIFRSPLVRLKAKLGIDVLDSSFDAQLSTIIEESTSFAIDIGAEPILHERFSETPQIIKEITGSYSTLEIYSFLGYYTWHDVFYSPLTKWPPREDDAAEPDYNKWLDNYVAYNNMNVPFGAFDKESDLDIIPLGDLSYSDEDYDKLLKDEVPYYMTLKYNKAYNDFITLLDELCYVNAKIYFDSPDSGYVTNQYAQRKGELQWRIQSILEDRMGLPNTWQIVEEPKWEQEP